MTINVFDIFCMGVDYGQLLMEEERDNNWADAMGGYVTGRKFGMPSQYIQHREIHSEKWFEAKRKSHADFLELLIKLKTTNEIIFVE